MQQQFKPLWRLLQNTAWAGQKPLTHAGSVFQLTRLQPYSTDDSDHDKPAGRHPHFPVLSENTMQARLEDAEVAKSWDALFTSEWFSLRDSPSSTLYRSIAQPFWRLRMTMMNPVISKISEVSQAMIQNEIEGAFDSDEFLEGAGFAVAATCEQLGAQDWETMRQVCSEKLVDRFKIAQMELEAEHGLRLTSLRLKSIDAVRLGPASLWTAENIAKFDESWAAEVDSVTTSSSFLVVTAGVRATLQAEFEPAGEEADDEASASVTSKPRQGGRQSQTLQREGSWLFTRGPLPKGFKTSLDLPWRVLAVW